MTHEEQEAERLREVLRLRLKRVPDRINGGSVQAVRDYKQAYVRATKLLNKSSASPSDLQSAINQVS